MEGVEIWRDGALEEGVIKGHIINTRGTGLIVARRGYVAITDAGIIRTTYNGNCMEVKRWVAKYIYKRKNTFSSNNPETI